MTETVERRTFLAGATAVAVAGFSGPVSATEAAPMYGLIGKMEAKPGQREALLAILLEGTSSMPGCLSYIIARDPSDPDAIWITEVWDSKASHEASLSLPAVRAAIGKAKPIIAGFENGTVTEPVGGHGLSR